MSPPNGIDLEDDPLMQHLLKRKKRLEELEEYNGLEALLKKKRAVREEAKRTPALRTSTDLDFDDDIEASDPAEKPTQQENAQSNVGEEDVTDRWARKSKRGRRRARSAMRRRALKAQQQQQEQPIVQGAR
ncbi:hypothetical protein M409DRAFT_30468 [Zasmidium cellare ATCC 36951]|uniref:Uncharacterized protein n=1 Tax=Zasmidium cellare ATCC 36951 TaxID=1080233 RepID=A0A6A6BYB0_ZASCE|nr:uncharacterized protein M409DRAFT_30468 [Zasmidium cellare ATCC 36951]KAF2159048.1 hypothetical protein M409DRAFT_30468 [Zasmidium cellare ATCC 36951]